MLIVSFGRLDGCCELATLRGISGYANHEEQFIGAPGGVVNEVADEHGAEFLLGPVVESAVIYRVKAACDDWEQLLPVAAQ